MISRTIILAASSLLAALPSTLAGTTFTMGVTGKGTNATTATATTATSAAAGATSTGSTKVWAIQVGSSNGSLSFSPDTISGAQVGDMLQFQFHPMNHSVVMGDYNNACQPVSNSTNAFYSGFMPTTGNGQLTYSVMVKDTNPIWMYCAQGKHCQEGMVAVVNPPASGQSLADYKSRAAMASTNVAPAAASGGTSSSVASGAASTGMATSGATGATGATPSGPTTTTSGVAAATNSNVAASTLQASSWSLGFVAAIAVAFF